MGSTLTNTQPKDTYKSLLKTSDSTELSATAKLISDGNGNDSVLALSTAAVDIHGRLDLKGTSTTVGHNALITNDNSNFIIYASAYGGTGKNIQFWPTGAGEVARVTTNGLTFNGDTAAANALDDYEEGTWTPRYMQGGVLNTATYSVQEGTYTKIGNLVTVFFDVDASSITSGSGTCEIDGLPFSSGSGMAGYSCVQLRDPSALAGTVSNVIFSGYVQRPAAYLVIRTFLTTTGGEGAATSWNALARVTGVAQYTV